MKFSNHTSRVVTVAALTAVLLGLASNSLAQSDSKSGNTKLPAPSRRLFAFAPGPIGR